MVKLKYGNGNGNGSSGGNWDFSPSKFFINICRFYVFLSEDQVLPRMYTYCTL